jgi:two-component system, cell cycle sensor histidine kinase and response regulator CckA
VETPLNILIIEDSLADFRLVERHLKRNGITAECHRVESRDALQDALAGGPWHLVLSDHKLPKIGFQEILDVLRPRLSELPLILVSGSVGEERAVELLKSGIWDFVLKDNLTRLVPAIERSLRDAAERRARLEAEQALRDSEERYRRLFDVESDALYLVDSESGRFLDANPAALKLYGYTRDEILQMRAANVSYEPDKTEHAITDQETKVPLRWHRKKNGTVFPVEITGGYFEAGGQKIHVAAIRDISEQHWTQKALARLHQRNDLILSSAAEGILGLDLYGRHTFVNPAAAGMLGYSIEELLDRSAAETWHRVQPDGSPSTAEDWGAREQTRSLDTFWRKDGSSFPVECASTPILEHDNPVGFVVSFNDITGRRQAEAALRESEFLLRTILSLIPHFIFVKDRDSRYLLVNRACAASYGLTPEQVTGRCDLELAANPEDAEGFMRDDREVVDSGRPKFIPEEKLTTPAGETRILQTTKIPFSAPGKGPALIGVALDVTELKRAEAMLRQSEAEFRAVFETASIGLAQADVQTGQWLRVNQKLCSITGYSVEEMMRMRVPEITHPEDRERDWALFQQVVRDEVPSYRNEKRYIRKDGGIAWVNVNMTVVRDPEGRPLRTVATIEDITERKRVEAALQESEHLLHTVIDLVPHFIFAKDTGGRYLFANRACASNNAMTPEQMIGRTDMELVPDCCEAEGFRRDDQEVIESGRLKFIPDERITNSAGVVRILQTTKIPFAAPDGPAVMGVSVDVTDLKQAEQELRESEQHLQLALAAANMGAWEVTLRGAGQSVVWTDQYGALFGRNRGQFPTDGVMFMECVHPDDRDQVRTKFERAFRESTAVETEFRVIWPDGSVHWHQSMGRAVVAEEHQPPRMVGVGMDVTERRELEAQLRQAQKLEAVGQLAGGVAHDFNNILAAFMMRLNLLQLNPFLDGETRHALEDLEAESHRAAGLTRQLLLFSRRSRVEMKPADLNQVLDNLLGMLRRLIGEDVDLRVEPKTTLPLVEADAGMLEQMLINLVVNARDAMPKGGRLTISVATEDLDGAHAALRPTRRAGTFVCLTVTDTGCGMDSVTLKRIFEPFFTTKEVGKGTGLGLATVHGIVVQHKGWIEVDSKVGEGTVFRVYLPALPGPAVDTEDPIPTEPPLRRGTETILLVEDEPKVRNLVAQALRVLGYTVHEAVDGQQALSLWGVHGADVDLLLTDMIMPGGMTGLELTDRLQSIKPGLLAIISSGYSAEIAQTSSPAREGVAYLPKPYEVKTLADKLRESLDRGRTTES